jgi:hypothetical protein
MDATRPAESRDWPEEDDEGPWDPAVVEAIWASLADPQRFSIDDIRRDLEARGATPAQ